MPPTVALAPPTLGNSPQTSSAFLVAVRVRPPDAVTQHYAGHEHRHLPHQTSNSIVTLQQGVDGRPSLHVQHYVPTALGMSASRATSVEPQHRRSAARTTSYTRSVSSTRSDGKTSSSNVADTSMSRPTTPGQRRARGDTASRANAAAMRATETVFEFDMCFVPPPLHAPLPNPAGLLGAPEPIYTDSSQRAVHDAVGVHTIDHLLRGYNTCLMAYGQTGSGKTYTMLGPGWDDVMTKWSPARQRAASERAELVTNLALSEERGLMLRTCELMFQRLKQAEQSEAVRHEVMRAVWADLLCHEAPSTAGSPRPPPSTASATAGGSRTTTPASTPRYHSKQHLPAAAVAPPPAATTQPPAPAAAHPQPHVGTTRPHLTTAATAHRGGRGGLRTTTTTTVTHGRRADPHAHLHHGGTGGKSPDDVFGEVIKRSVSQHRTDGDDAGGAGTPTEYPPAEYETAFETRHDKRTTMRRQPWYTAGALAGTNRNVEVVSDDSDAEDFLVAMPTHPPPAAALSTTPGVNRGKIAASPQRRLSSSTTTLPFASPAKTEASINVSACTDEDEGGESAPNAPVPAVPPQPHPMVRLPTPTAPLQRMASTASAASGYEPLGPPAYFDPTQYDEDVQVVVTFYQIYNEKVWCLLRPNNTPLKVREHSAIGTYVEDLFQVNVADYDSLIHAIEAGNRSRRVAATVHNRQSSRSHAIFSVQVIRRLRLKATNSVDEDGRPIDRPWMHLMSSVLNLVDLAGSERVGGVEGVSAQRWKEATDINSSLTALAKVIQALSEKHRNGGPAGFVPYRESALTWLLRDCFGGNARTVMLATISPEMKDVEETLNTLRYSSRARRIVNRPVVNGQSAKNQAAIIASLQREIIALRAQLASYAAPVPPSLSASGPGPSGGQQDPRFHNVPAALVGRIDLSSCGAVRSPPESEEHLRLKARLEESERLMIQMTSPPRNSTPGATRATTPRRTQAEVVLSLSSTSHPADDEAAKAAAHAAMVAQRVQLESLEEQVRQYKTATHRLDEQIGALRRTLESNWAAREAAASSRSLAEDAELDRRLGSAEPLLDIFDDIPAAASTEEVPPLSALPRPAPVPETSRHETTTSVFNVTSNNLTFNNSSAVDESSMMSRRENSLLRGPAQTPGHAARPAPHTLVTVATSGGSGPGGPGGASHQPRSAPRVSRGASQSKSLLYSDDEEEAPSLRRPSWAQASSNGSPTRRSSQGPQLYTSQRAAAADAIPVRRHSSSPKHIDLAAHQRAMQQQSTSTTESPSAAATTTLLVPPQRYGRHHSASSLVTSSAEDTTTADSTPELLDLAALRPHRDVHAIPITAPLTRASQAHHVDPTERRAAARLAPHSMAPPPPPQYHHEQHDSFASKKPRSTTPRSVGFVEPVSRTMTMESTSSAPPPAPPRVHHPVDVHPHEPSTGTHAQQLAMMDQRRAAVMARMKQLDAILADDAATPVRSTANTRRPVDISSPSQAPTSAPLVDVPPMEAPHGERVQSQRARPTEDHATPIRRSTQDLLTAPNMVAPLWVTPVGTTNAQRQDPIVRRPPSSPHPGRSPTSPSLSHRRATTSNSTGTIFAPRRQGSPEPLAMPAPTQNEPSTPEEARQRAQERFTRILNKMNAASTTTGSQPRP